MSSQRMTPRMLSALVALAAVLLVLSTAPATGQQDTQESEELPLGWEVGADENTLAFDLERQTVAGAVEIGWDGSGPYSFDLEASEDGSSWEPVAQDLEGGEQSGTESYELDGAEGRYVRIVLRDEPSGTVSRAVTGFEVVRSPVFSQQLGEDFEGLATGFLPYNWEGSKVEGGEITVEEVGSTNQALRLRDESETAKIQTDKVFRSGDQDVRLEYRVRAEQTDETIGLQLTGQTSGVRSVTVGVGDNGQLYTFVGGERKDLLAYEPGDWYDIRIDARPSEDRFDLYVDGELLVEDGEFRTPASTLTSITVNTSDATTGTSYYDDFRLQVRDSAEGAAFEGPFEDVGYPLAGTLEPRSADEIEDSNWSVGGETLDRGFADFSAYKEYLGPLGAQQIRLQGGWARTEREPGEYDFSWLDEAVEGAVDEGVEPWLQLSYGNEIYEGGGDSGLGGGLPSSEEALEAWDSWVAAMVDRYGDRTTTWEVWNEPDLRDNISPEEYAEFYIRTAKNIREKQPGANLISFSLARPNTDYVRRALEVAEEQDALDLFDDVGFHVYRLNPDDDGYYNFAQNLRQTTQEFSPDIEIRQTENGAPSQRQASFALANYPWTESAQAKWDLRRMLGDLGRDIESSVFQISDMRYDLGEEIRWNTKGLLQVDSDLSVRSPKQSYSAVQHLTTLFDSSLARIMDYSYNSSYENLSVFGYAHTEGLGQTATIWVDEGPPVDSSRKRLIELTLADGEFDEPVYVDLRTGAVYEVPQETVSGEDGVTFEALPVYDSPVVIAERSLVEQYLKSNGIG